jgi:hypothetical protein
MRVALLAAALLSGVVAGCGSSSETDETATTTSARPARASSKIEKCVDRFLERVNADETGDTSTEEIRRYAERTYCVPFDRRGWVNENGTLDIAAYRSITDAAMCTTGEPDEAARTVPCDQLERRDRPRILDCALLHQVPRTQVRRYLDQLRPHDGIECDDGTPLAKLGAP